ncbi:MAG: OST-HTH/LOTUS domain-containing protein, partial [Bacteroidales bacterium]|nr:OST-HTH/LOTUS domain-containing protein [Bacteroidales bacterium]
QNQYEKISPNLIELLKKSVEDLADESGWVFMAEIGALIIKKKPDFDPRNYGFSKLTPLFKSLKKHFIIDEREVENTHIKHIFVKIK